MPDFNTGAQPVILVDQNGAALSDTDDGMLKVKSVQKKFRDSFSTGSLNPANWTSSNTGGGSIAVAGGQLTMGSGTTANGETSITSVETFTIPFRVSIGFTLSQRIANQSFYVEAISVDPKTGEPDGQHCAALMFDGTSLTQVKYEVQNGGLPRLTSAGVTFPTTASSGVYEIEPFADETWFHGGTLDSTSGRTNSYRRHQQIPHPNALYKLRLRWLNGATPPASNTNAVVQYIAVQDYAELTAEITAGRGQSSAGQALAVSVVNAITADQGTPRTPTASIINSAATTNGTSVKNAGGNIYSIVASNTNAAARFLKLYNLATAPTVGTSAVALTIAIPANGFVNLDFGTYGVRFGTGIALAITGAAVDSDTTAIGAGEVKVCTSYI